MGQAALRPRRIAGAACRRARRHRARRSCLLRLFEPGRAADRRCADCQRGDRPIGRRRGDGPLADPAVALVLVAGRGVGGLRRLLFRPL